jgi:hypothetical protein
MKIISLWPKLHCFFPCYLCSAVYFLAFLEQLYACMGGGSDFQLQKQNLHQSLHRMGGGHSILVNNIINVFLYII